MIDIDDLKDYNDDFGQVAGDQLLCAVTTMFNERKREGDFVARQGGAGFCLVFPDTSASTATIVLGELHRRCAEIEAERPVTFSAGIAEYAVHENVPDVLERSAAALHEAKSAGSGQTYTAPERTLLDVVLDPSPLRVPRALSRRR